MLASLRHRDFRLLWSATFVSNAGSWMQKVTTAWLIYEMTHSNAWLGTDAFASGMTTVLLLPLGGVIADRVDRRWLLVITNILCAVFAFILALLAAAHLVHVWHIIAFSAMSGVVQAAMIPASNSLLPALVGKDDVPNAIALNSLQFNVSRAIGPILGGIALIHFGAASSFALNGFSFLVLVGAFIFIRTVPPVSPTNLGWARSLLEGLQFIRRRNDLLRSLSLIAITAMLGAPVVSLLPALTADVLGRQASSYSFLLTCFGIGAIVTAIGAALLGKRLARPMIITTLIVCVGATEIALAFSGWWTATVLVAVAGLAFVGVNIQLGTTILQDTGDEYRGRVTSVQQICFRTGQPLGALTGGFIADRTGIGLVFGLFGGLLLASALIAVLTLRPARSKTT